MVRPASRPPPMNTSSPSAARRIAPTALATFVADAARRAGLPDAAATTLAAALVQADTMGVHTHGTKLLVGYLRKLVAGGYRAAAEPRVLREGPGWAVVDGGQALGQIGSSFAMEIAIAKARTVGVATVALRDTGHIGAAGCYALQAARAGLVGIVAGNDMPSVAAPGSRGAVLGSNPLAWAAPVPGSEPLLLDIATAAVAGGKVYAAVQRGEPLPQGWLIGPDGLPTTDGSLYPGQASLAPMAGHKGFGFGLLAEILSGVLAGGTVTRQVGSWMFDPAAEPSRHNAGFIAIDAATIAGPEAYGQAIAHLAAEIRAAAPAVGCDRVRLPGDLEWERRGRALADGIDLPDDVRVALHRAAETVSAPLPDFLRD